jgi:hypothetical protein
MAIVKIPISLMPESDASVSKIKVERGVEGKIAIISGQFASKADCPAYTQQGHEIPTI